MTQRLFILFVFIGLSAAAFLSPGPFRESLRGLNDNIDISIVESDEQIRLTAIYPRHKSDSIQAYIKNFFGLTDIYDMKGLSIEQYDAPDKSISFAIQSRDCYLKIIMKKDSNSPEAHQRLKLAAKGMQQVLASH